MYVFIINIIIPTKKHKEMCITKNDTLQTVSKWRGNDSLRKLADWLAESSRHFMLSSFRKYYEYTG